VFRALPKGMRDTKFNSAATYGSTVLRLDLTLKIECISFHPFSAFKIRQAKQAFLISFLNARAFAYHLLRREFFAAAREILSGV
jgi:hypothetical protein